MGQYFVFEGASQVLHKILHVDISNKQIQRVSEWYGNQIDPIIEANHTDYMAQLKCPKQRDEKTYVMVDGSMIYTREGGWKEMKLARVFHDSQNIDIQQGRNEIQDTVYVSHLGGKDKFFAKVERHLSLIKTPKVFVCDGAKYIWNWIEDNYPGSIQILDYYHAIEKVTEFARHHLRLEEKRKSWVSEQKVLLLEDQVEQVILNIKKCKPNNAKAAQAKQAVLRYYIQHADRMMYKTFKNAGFMIGSGPVEAAHRHVIQQRMKLSGQKWSIKGANAIANLRCYQKSGVWNKIEALIKLAA